MLLEKDIKKNSIKIKDLLAKELKKEIPKITDKKFDVWEVITKTISSQIELDYFCVGNNDWGSNNLKITKYFWEKFFKDFKGKSRTYEGHSIKFKENLYNLLKLSVNKTPQKLNKNRTFPFKQQTKHGQSYALPGHETFYSNKHNPENYYYYNYCNVTKIKFFKGPTNQEEQIIKNNWQNIFSESFIYGYILGAVKIICDLGTFEIKKKNPKDNLSDIVAIFKKNGFTNLIYNQKYIQKLIIEFYESFYKISKNESSQLATNIQNSIFKSKLSHFLYLKNENYFIYNLKNTFSDENDGTGDFVAEISRRKRKYLANIKNKRFTQVALNVRKEKINKIWPNTLDQADGCIINYEQFRLYTLSLPYLNPYTEKQLNINERDIFIRYAVNLGVQEILFYVTEKIFSHTHHR
jgi:hypothetical protein